MKAKPPRPHRPRDPDLFDHETPHGYALSLDPARGYGRGLPPGPREGYPPTPTPPAAPPCRHRKRR